MTVTNITIPIGATFQRNITLTDNNGNPLSVSGYTANAALKKEWTSNTSTLFEVNLTTGICSIRMEANTTVNLTPGYYNYDVKMTNGTDTFRIMEGIAFVTPQIAL